MKIYQAWEALKEWIDEYPEDVLRTAEVRDKIDEIELDYE